MAEEGRLDREGEGGPDRRLRYGMAGGGPDAFFGAVHRAAARLDNRFELVAGCFSTSAEKNAAMGRELRIAPDRVYRDVADMARSEAARPDGIDMGAVVVPNHLHFPAAMALLDHGIHVMCEKPMTTHYEDALTLAERVRATGRVLALAHTYTGYAMVRQARAMVAAGALGEIRVVQAEYPQEWLARDVERSGLKQALWRLDPRQAGPGGSVGDIAVHGYNLIRYICGIRLAALSADLSTFVEGRRLDDNAHFLLRFEGGARGMLWSSQVAIGEKNALRIRVYGTEGSLQWAQEEPERLLIGRPDGSSTLLTRGSVPGEHGGRLPAGHPEGLIEALGQLYGDVAEEIRARRTGERRSPPAPLPGVDDGVEGMAFIAAAVESARRDAAWVSFPAGAVPVHWQDEGKDQER